MAEKKPESHVNDQIIDAVDEANATVLGSAEDTASAMAQQVMAQAIGLAMQNAVHQQQQLYVLRNAATTAASRALLQADPAKALELTQSLYNTDDITKTLAQFKALMDDIAMSGQEADPAPSPKASKPKSTAKKTAKKSAKKGG